MKLFQNYILKNHRAIVLMALFSWTSAKVLGNSVKSDTLVIHGKTIHVQVKEKSEYEKEQHTDKSEVDSVTQSEKCTKYLGVFSSAGICDNRINHKSGPLLLEEFIGEESLKGNYKEFGIEFLLETPRNIWLGANFSFLNWEIRQNKYVGDYSSFFRFENYSQGELTQIDRYKEGIGFEFDTLNANLIRERNSEKFLLGLGVNFSFLF